MGSFDVMSVIDGVPYKVRVTPFDFNNEKRFRVAYGDGEYVFAYDSGMGKYAAIGDEAVAIPDSLETELAERLENYKG